MKKTITILIVLLLPLMGWAGKNVKKGQLASFISEYRHVEGVECVRLGSFATAAIKSAIRISASNDPDSRQAMKAISGVKRLTVFDYEDCSQAAKERINWKLHRILRGSELLMEVKDGSDSMRMYGVLEEDGQTVRDFVLYTPDSCALICIFGKISMDALAQIAEDND